MSPEEAEKGVQRGCLVAIAGLVLMVVGLSLVSWKIGAGVSLIVGGLTYCFYAVGKEEKT